MDAHKPPQGFLTRLIEVAVFFAIILLLVPSAGMV